MKEPTGYRCNSCGADYLELGEAKTCCPSHGDTISEIRSQLLIDDSQGIYIPKQFIDNFDIDKWHLVLDEETTKDLQSPENDHYWDAWEYVLENAYWIDDEDNRYYRLEQDGSLFAKHYEESNDE